MGKVSNLITDMTLRGATEDELAKAVRHSMVVIDAEKHKLDYKQSEIDNDIATLKKDTKEVLILRGVIMKVHRHLSQGQSPKHRFLREKEVRQLMRMVLFLISL